jgi:hypothetical protein
MALLTRASDASVDASTAMFAEQISGKVAGETIEACDACYVSGTDGLVYKSNGTAANAAAKVDGFAAQGARAGQGVTLFGRGLRMRYSAGGLTPAALYYLGTTAGQLDTATTTGGTVALCKAIDTTDLRVVNIVP